MAILGAKPLQNIEGMQKEVLYDIFVYIHKFYDALDWVRALAIPEGCGVGAQVLQILTQYLGGAMDLWLDALVLEQTLGVTPNW